MKIIQVITGHPQVIYLTELFNGLKSIGVDVKIYCFNDEVNVFGHFDTSHISNVEYTQDVFDELNSCDFVFFNDIPHVKYEHTDEFIDMVVNKITAPKIFFNNIHSILTCILGLGIAFIVLIFLITAIMYMITPATKELLNRGKKLIKRKSS